MVDVQAAGQLESVAKPFARPGGEGARRGLIPLLASGDGSEDSVLLPQMLTVLLTGLPWKVPSEGTRLRRQALAATLGGNRARDEQSSLSAEVGALPCWLVDTQPPQGHEL